MLRGEIKQRTRLEVSVPFVQLMAKQREIEGLDIHVKPMVTMFGRALERFGFDELIALDERPRLTLCGHVSIVQNGAEISTSCQLKRRSVHNEPMSVIGNSTELAPTALSVSAGCWVFRNFGSA